jgi:ribosomal protein S11
MLVGDTAFAANPACEKKANEKEHAGAADGHFLLRNPSPVRRRTLPCSRSLADRWASSK